MKTWWIACQFLGAAYAVRTVVDASNSPYEGDVLHIAGTKVIWIRSPRSFRKGACIRPHKVLREMFASRRYQATERAA